MTRPPTAPQVDALRSLLGLMDRATDRTYRSADHAGAHSSTLASLVARGLVERRLSQSSLRGGERWGYRLTTRGRTVARRLS